MAQDEFIGEEFLLQNTQAVELYQNCARDMPIIDCHCHLGPDRIA